MTSNGSDDRDYVPDSVASSDESEERPTKMAKNEKWKRNSEGFPFFELSRTRRVTVRKFSGKQLIDIREFYDKDGEWTPGKKGISLTIEQYEKLKSLMNDIDEAIKDSRV